MIIAGVDFPEPLLNALRDGRLVVFAGAGVSMGPPAGLPDFRRLAELVAEGTGQSIGNAETEDQFLARLKDRGTDVHQRAADILQRDNPEPTKLHLNLLRLFGEPKDVRAVTTNFDDLFERVALDQFDREPNIFQSPNLPLGNRFRGIVHLHGSVYEPEEMVLTSQDFGRAYLTEADGWARRFLVDLFTNCTVLFVGYSHSDTIMTYLTPSLPPNDDQKRFALVGDQSDDPNHWHRMGIEPIAFHQTDANDFRGLDEAVAGLAHIMRRRVLDWEREIAAVANGYPPLDDESAGIIDHALTDPVTTRFFVEAAELPEWVEWLARRGHLAALFTDAELTQRDQTLLWWLVSRFAIAHDGTLFALIGLHPGRLSPTFWQQLTWQLQDSIAKSPDPTVMTRWVLFLAGIIPADAEESALSWLAEACASVGEPYSLLRVYDAMTARLSRAPPGLGRHNSGMFHYYMQNMLAECIKPNLPEMAEPLLALTTIQFKTRQAVLTAWQQGDASQHWDNFSRSAIEPHEQDDGNQDIDPLIDTARECLEWLAANAPFVAAAWCDRHVDSNTPLLRRLAVHAIAARNDLIAEDKIAWLLERCDVNEINAHHEIFRAVAQAYPLASSQQRRALIQAISEYQAPEIREREHWDASRISAYHRFTWFHWLHDNDPDCSMVKEALDAVRAQHPEFVPEEHPDFTHWSWSGIFTNAWNANALLARPAAEVLSDLLAYQPTDQQRFEGQDRWGMLGAVEEAARTNPSWSLDLADTMAGIGAWDSDLWTHVITAWATAEFDQENVIRVLSHLSSGELHRQHTRQIADVLSELVQKTDGTEKNGLPDEANSIAIDIRPYAAADRLPEISSSIGGVPQYVSWLEKSLGHTSGRLALFWIHSIALWCKQQQPTPKSLNLEYRNALDTIVREDGITGRFGRTVLASQFQFLIAVDERWTLNNLLPLFGNDQDDFQCAWDGFLSWGRLSPPIAEHLREKLITAVPRIVQEFDHRMLARFVEYYSVALGWLINNANDHWITELFKHADAGTKHQFAASINHRLRDLDESGQQEWWNVWLKDYWENRLLGVPSPLDDAEIAQMLEWVMHLPGVFPEAVDVATRMRPVPMSQSLMLHNISVSSLIDTYPNDLARFLVYLARCNDHPWLWHGTRSTVDRLMAKGLPTDLDDGLRELTATHHQWMKD